MLQINNQFVKHYQNWTLLFFFGVFLIPFDNLKFAPSAGWATLSPYIFLLAVILATLESPVASFAVFSQLIKKTIIYVLPLALISFISFLLFGFSSKFILLTATKLFLGLCFFLCLCILNETYDSWLKFTFSALISGYAISLGMGLVQWISLIAGAEANAIFESISARSYNERIQFSFTEPSFTSSHIYGVILPLFLMSLSRIDVVSSKQLRSMLLLSFAFFIISIASGSSLRILADSILILVALLFIFPLRLKIKIMISAVLCIIAILPVIPQSISDRVDNIFTSSDDDLLDASAVIRKFRVESALGGYLDSSYTVLFGYGFGNSKIAMDNGFQTAYSNLTLEYDEIEGIKSDPDGLTYSLPIKFLVEHGALGLLFVLSVMYRRTHKLLFMTFLIVSVQFDSYAFYSLWLYLFSVRSGYGSDDDIVSFLIGRIT